MDIHDTIIIMGRSGSGKGTQIELLRDYFKNSYPQQPVFYFESGKEFRNFIKDDGYTNKLMRSFIGQGTLAPDFITEWLLVDALVHNITEDRELIILDGFPRTVPQAQTLISAMDYYEREKVTILHIEVSEDEVRKRMLSRGRGDDQNRESINRRIDWYNKNVIPAIDYLRLKKEYKVIDVNGEGEVDEIHESIIKALGFKTS